MADSLRWLVCALACALPGCTRPNLAFDGGLDGEGSATSSQPVTGDASAAATEAGSASAGSATSSQPVTGDASAATTEAGSASTGASTSEGLPTSSSGDVLEGTALLVTGSGELGQPLDQTLFEALDTLGLDVGTITDDLVTAGDAEAVDVVVISESAISAEVGGTLRDVPRPIVVIEGDVWSAMGMASASFDQPGRSIVIEAPGHPIAANQSGEVTVLVEASGSGRIVAADLPAGAQVIARSFAGGAPVVFTLEEGTELLGKVVAPARRVGMGFDADAAGIADGDLNEVGVLMFTAAVEWAMQ